MSQKISALDRQTAKTISQELNDLLKDFATSHGLLFNPSSVSYSTDTFRTKVELRLESVDGVNIDKKDWDRVCTMFELKPEDFNAIINVGSKTYKLIRIDTKKRQYPIIATEVSTGKTFKLPIDRVLFSLGRTSNRSAFDFRTVL